MRLDAITIVDIVLFVGVAQGLLLCVPLLRYKNNRAPNRVLAAFIVLLDLDLVLAYLNNSSIVLTYPFLYDINASFAFLFTPIMYVYVSVLSGKITRFRSRYLAHLIPFFLHVIFMYFVFYRLSDSAKIEIISATQASGRIIDRRMFLLAPEGPFPFGGAFPCAVAIAYIVGTAKRIQEYRIELRNYYSDIRNKVFGVLIFCLVTMLSIWLLVTIFLVSGARNQIYPMLLYTVAIYVGLYKMVTIPEVFSGNRAMNAQLASVEGDERPRQEIALEKFREYLRRSKAYLNPELTISDVGGKICVPVHQLSKALNLGLGKNFYQCVNELRVEEAKRMLTDERFSETSILAIGMDSGFNSKSTFNDVFKKIAGLTPSEFRKRVIVPHAVAEKA